jgi:hypothetical protein
VQRVLRQISGICQAAESAGGSCFFALAPYWVIDTAYGGGYQRIVEWRDAFRAGGPYSIQGHVEHAAIQAIGGYAPNRTTLTGGGLAALTFNDAYCRYTIGGAFSSKTAHSLFIISDVQAVSAGTAVEMKSQNEFGWVPNHSGNYYWYGGSGAICYSTLVVATGQAMRGVTCDSAISNITFYCDAVADPVARGATGVAAVSGVVTLFSLASGAYGTAAKRAMVLYCSGAHSELAPLVNSLQPYLADLTVSVAVAILEQIRVICAAEEAAGGSCLMLLPGDWIEANPVSTWADIFTPTIPGVGWSSHVPHDLTQTTDANEPVITTLPNGSPALVGGTSVNLGAAAPWPDHTSRTFAAICIPPAAGLTANVGLFGGGGPGCTSVGGGGWTAIDYFGDSGIAGPARSAGLQSLTLQQDSDSGKNRVTVNGALTEIAYEAGFGATAKGFSLGYPSIAWTFGTFAAYLFCTSANAQLAALWRRLGQLMFGAP